MSVDEDLIWFFEEIFKPGKTLCKLTIEIDDEIYEMPEGEPLEKHRHAVNYILQNILGYEPTKEELVCYVVERIESYKNYFGVEQTRQKLKEATHLCKAIEEAGEKPRKWLEKILAA